MIQQEYVTMVRGGHLFDGNPKLDRIRIQRRDCLQPTILILPKPARLTAAEKSKLTTNTAGAHKPKWNNS